MKKKVYGTITIAFIYFFSTAQNAYWQQQVDYKIEVALNDSLHELDGFVTIQYKNNSPENLNCIYFHLWPNAYKNQTSALAKQMLENGKTKFWYSKPYQRGYMDSLNFKVNAEACQWKYDSSTTEICKLILNQPLPSGESIKISTPFHVKLPETFSRLGHIGQSYQITQWYPKPAVFDKYGWHPMPYLDQGEFYSEFGSYDVSITLPENYVVGATGDLQDASEINRMNELAAATEKVTTFSNDGDLSFPKSSVQLKTIHFKQNNIHDFGWFADKRYHVLKGEVELPYSKRKVTTWSLFTNNQAKYWSKAPEYLHDAIYYYSSWIGEYPYAQVTAVDGTISAGSGMEYPNVTVIGEERNAFSLDDVITHEVGHNWFYGMLGTNERDHAWMDEGINSYYENRYLRTKYPNRKVAESLPEGVAKFLDVNQYKHKYLMDLGYQVMARENMDEPVEQTSSRFTDINYGIIVYGKTMLIFDYLEAYLGTLKFDTVMKKYFTQWQYKHPQPENIRKVFEDETGKDLSWFFDDLIKTKKKIDYKIVKATREKCAKSFTGNCLEVQLRNTGDVYSPVLISEMKNDSVLQTHVLEGFKRDTTFNLYGIETNRIQIDPLFQIPEINRKNNTYKLNKIAHRFEKFRLQFIGSIENSNRTQMLFAPYLAWNNYDKTQVGLAFYSPFLPAQKFSYLLVPAVGTASKQFIGFGKLNYNFYPDNLQQFTVGVSAKRFSYLLFPQNMMFNKVEPHISIELKKKNSRSPYTHSLNMRSAVIWLDWLNFENKKKETQRYYVNEIKYRMERNTTLHPFNVQVTFQQGNSFAGLWAEGNFKISYKQHNQEMRIRVFAGGFPLYLKSSSDISSPLPKLYLSYVTDNNFAYWLQKDYMFDENYLDRNGRDKYLGRQVSTLGAGFHSFTNFGATNKFMSAVNISSSIYKFIPIHPFLSAAVLLNDNKKMQFAAEFGLSAVLVKDMIEIHLPLATTKNISDSQKINGINKWYQKFTFTLKLQLQKPVSLIRQFAGL
jgi:hypothetical protein